MTASGAIRSRWLPWAVGVLLVLALSPPFVARHPASSDLGVYHDAWRRTLDGRDIYWNPETGAPTTFLYPPPFAVLLSPLGRVPYPWVRLSWCVVSGLLALRALWAALRLVERERGPEPFPPWAAALATLLAIRFVVEDVGHGQVNTLVTALALEGAWRAESGRERSGAACLGAAIAVKLVPGILVLGYLCAGRRRMALLSAAWCAAWLLVPGFVIGFGANLELLRRFVVEVSAWNYRHSACVPANTSLTGVVHHHLVGRSVHHFSSEFTPSPLGLSMAVGRAVSTGLALGVLALVSVWTIRARPGPAHRTAALFAAIPLVSPVIWKPHLVGLLPCYAVAARLLVARTAGRAATVALVLGVALTAGTTRALIGREGADQSLRWGVVCLGIVALFAGLVLAPAAEPQPEPAAP